jgi:hypothetical protein
MHHREHFGPEFGFGITIAEPNPLFLDSMYNCNQFNNQFNNPWNNSWNNSWNCAPPMPEYINMTPPPYYPVATPPFMPVYPRPIAYAPRPFFGIGGRHFSIGISI